MIENKIISNTALYGGVLFLDNIKILKVLKNHLIRNSAVRFQRNFGKGGFSFADSPLGNDHYTIEFQNNSFKLTTADIGGVFLFKTELIFEGLMDEENIKRKNKFFKTKVHK